MSFQVSYVGHLSHRLLVQEDLAMPLNIVDPNSKVDYFSAAKRLSQMAADGTSTADVNAASVGPTAAYWQNMIKPLMPGDQYNLSCSGPINTTGVTPTYTSDPVQAAYDLFSCNTFNETTALGQLDFLGSTSPAMRESPELMETTTIPRHWALMPSSMTSSIRFTRGVQ